MESTRVDTPSEAARRDALVERMFQQIVGYQEVVCLYIGDRLGFYRALAGRAPATAPELAAASGTDLRYTREWLEQQAVAGVLDVDDVGAAPDERRYSLPPGHAEVLLDRESLSHLMPFARAAVGTASPLPALLDAFRTGEGIAYEDYGVDTREGIADGNRPMFLNQLGSEWIPAMPDIHLRLTAGPPARVADVGCGSGWSSIGLARAYPNARIDGFDIDAPSIDAARRTAEAEGLSGRVRFEVADAARMELDSPYDLVTVFEAIHDMAHPIRALSGFRRLVEEGGTVFIADEKVADEFTAPGDATERLMYGFSVMHCLPVGRTEPGSAETGTVMRSGTLRRYAREAGYAEVTVLDIEHDLWRFYRLTA